MSTKQLVYKLDLMGRLIMSAMFGSVAAILDIFAMPFWFLAVWVLPEDYKEDIPD